jgi:hypothetical protein
MSHRSLVWQALSQRCPPDNVEHTTWVFFGPAVELVPGFQCEDIICTLVEVERDVFHIRVVGPWRGAKRDGAYAVMTNTTLERAKQEAMGSLRDLGWHQLEPSAMLGSEKTASGGPDQRAEHSEGSDQC